MHLKQPAEALGPVGVLFDRAAGTVTLADHLDPLEWLRRQRGPVTAQHLANAMAAGEDVEAKHREKARRELQRLTRAGLANEREGVKGGTKGGTPTTWTAALSPSMATLTDASESDHGTDHAPVQHGAITTDHAETNNRRSGSITAPITADHAPTDHAPSPL
ncbi:hypothetical protein NKG05_26100 [Oerskovia sp. M15]